METNSKEKNESMRTKTTIKSIQNSTNEKKKKTL